MTRKDRWILSEYVVAKDRVENYGDALIYHQQTTPYAELDLIFESARTDSARNESARAEAARSETASPRLQVQAGAGDPSRILTIIEVKSVSSEIWGQDVISRKQRLRLERARSYVELKARRQTRLLLATVQAGRDGPVIHYFEAPF